jgi:hypothetical protein
MRVGKWQARQENQIVILCRPGTGLYRYFSFPTVSQQRFEPVRSRMQRRRHVISPATTSNKMSRLCSEEVERFHICLSES